MKIFILLAMVILLFSGCATTGTINVMVDTLAYDWPKASGAIRGGVGIENLPKSVIDDMDEIDGWFKDENGEWIDDEKLATLKLNTFQRWYITGVRAGHTGPVLRALVNLYAPGILSSPEMLSALVFLGLGM